MSNQRTTDTQRGTRDEQASGAAAGQHGAQAEKPTDIPAAGWKQIVVRAWKEAKADNVPMLAGGVAFFAFLSLFPAMIALISLWGLVVGGDNAVLELSVMEAHHLDNQGRVYDG